MMEKTVWQLPFHPRLPSRAKAFQCFLRGLRAGRADYIRKNESARLIFWTGRGKKSARAFGPWACRGVHKGRV
jgi:hypothetical protein